MPRSSALLPAYPSLTLTLNTLAKLYKNRGQKSRPKIAAGCAGSRLTRHATRDPPLSIACSLTRPRRAHGKAQIYKKPPCLIFSIASSAGDPQGLAVVISIKKSAKIVEAEPRGKVPGAHGRLPRVAGSKCVKKTYVEKPPLSDEMEMNE